MAYLLWAIFWFCYWLRKKKNLWSETIFDNNRRKAHTYVVVARIVKHSTKLKVNRNEKNEKLSRISQNIIPQSVYYYEILVNCLYFFIAVEKLTTFTSKSFQFRMNFDEKWWLKSIDSRENCSLIFGLTCNLLNGHLHINIWTVDESIDKIINTILKNVVIASACVSFFFSPKMYLVGWRT